MKRPLAWRNFCLLLATFPIATHALAQVPSGSVTVISIEVDKRAADATERVMMRSPADTEFAFRSLKLADTIPLGTSIFTSPNVYLTLKSSNGVLIRIQPETALGIDVMMAKGEKYIVAAGEAEFSVSAPLSFFDVDVRPSVVSTTQGRFSVRAPAEGEATATVIEGELSIFNSTSIIDNEKKHRADTIKRTIARAGTRAPLTYLLHRDVEVRFANATAIEKFFRNELIAADAAKSANNSARISDALLANSSWLFSSAPAESVKLFERYVKLNQQDLMALGYAYPAMGNLFLNMKAFDKACDKFEAALKISAELYRDRPNRTRTRVLRSLAACHEGLGNKKSAELYKNLTAIEDAKFFPIHLVRNTIAEKLQLDYPRSLEFLSLSGNSMVEITLPPTGLPTNIAMVQSSHPAFENAVVKAIVGGKFKLSDATGLPYSQQIRIPVGFSGKETRFGESRWVFNFSKIAPPSLPAAYQYDVAPTLTYLAQVVYPKEMLMTSTGGSAEVAVVLGGAGLPLMVEVVKASSPQFGAALRASAYTWQFSPAYQDGRSIAFSFKISHDFERDSLQNNITDLTRTLVSMLKKNPDTIPSVEQLDRPLVSRYTPFPIDTRQLSSAKVESLAETVTVDFFVDPEGGVQLPAFSDTKIDELGWAAVTAVQRWVFEIPLRDGKPTYVKHRLKLTFDGISR